MRLEVIELKFVKGKRGDVISRLPTGKVALVNKSAHLWLFFDEVG